MDKCIIDIPAFCNIDDFEQFMNQYVLVARLSKKHLKLNKENKQKFDELLNSIQNATYIEGIEEI